MSNKKVVYPVSLDPELKDAFLASAKANDENGSKLVRDFMRDYLKKKGQKNILF